MEPSWLRIYLFVTTTLFVAQPPANYAARQPLVVDASVLAAALFGEDQHELAVSWMRGHALTAPQLVDYEITNIVLSKLKHKQVDFDAAAQSLALYAGLDITCMPTAVDGVYALAAQLKAPLATFDQRLGDAAQACLGALGATS